MGQFEHNSIITIFSRDSNLSILSPLTAQLCRHLGVRLKYANGNPKNLNLSESLSVNNDQSHTCKTYLYIARVSRAG